jgi:hypothetical protein
LVKRSIGTCTNKLGHRSRNEDSTAARPHVGFPYVPTPNPAGLVDQLSGLDQTASLASKLIRALFSRRRTYHFKECLQYITGGNNADELTLLQNWQPTNLMLEHQSRDFFYGGRWRYGEWGLGHGCPDFGPFFDASVTADVTVSKDADEDTALYDRHAAEVSGGHFLLGGCERVLWVRGDRVEGHTMADEHKRLLDLF